MILKKLKKTTVLLLLLFIIPINVLAYSEYLIPGGENIGIQIDTSGIIVVGMYNVNGKNPAQEAGIKAGDIITKVDNKNVSSIDEMISKINSTNSNNIKLTYERDKTEYTTTLEIYKDENDIYKTGLYVKDSITGIGTLSFIDPNTKIFGALGHEIIEKNTGVLLEIKEGRIFETNVTSIDRSSNGTPGSKNAEFYIDSNKGIIKENTEKGIFGTYTSELPNKKLYKVARPEEITTGKAKILTVTKGNEVKEYEINILKLNKSSNQKTKNILFEITDKELLEKTGGVVQGMSGSSIIQGEYIIGAVTHVVIDNPTKGYGIFITNMLEEAEN